MILVLAGTKDGRDLADSLVSTGLKVMVSVVSGYGQELIANNEITVNARPLNAEQLVSLITNHGIKAIVDATHPYAVNVSKNAMDVSGALGLKYIRYERPVISLPKYHKLELVNDYEAAAKKAAIAGHVVFLTTGSRMLSTFKNEPALKNHRLIARVLPDPVVIKECFDLGFSPRDIIAMQGPFSHDLNLILFREFNADVIVTKNSGKLGGSDTKVSAAIELGLPIIIIDRPKIQYSEVVYNCHDVIRSLTEVI